MLGTPFPALSRQYFLMPLHLAITFFKAAFTSLFRMVYMKGFSSGVNTVLRTETTLLKLNEECAVGFEYMKRTAP